MVGQHGGLGTLPRVCASLSLLSLFFSGDTCRIYLRHKLQCQCWPGAPSQGPGGGPHAAEGCGPVRSPGRQPWASPHPRVLGSPQQWRWSAWLWLGQARLTSGLVPGPTGPRGALVPGWCGKPGGPGVGRVFREVMLSPDSAQDSGGRGGGAVFP